MPASSRSGGLKRSSWFIFRRRLILVRRLLRGPAHRDTLWDTVRAELGTHAWGESPHAALRHDLTALRREFGCGITYQHRTGYSLTDLGTLPLLDLPDDHLQALHTLLALADALPAHLTDQMTDLLVFLLSLLPPERQIARDDQTIEQFAAPQSLTSLDPALLRRLRRAIQRQQIRFRYRSTMNLDTDGILHRAAPYGLIMRDGHLYLDADCLWVDHPAGRARRLRYRIDRIDPASLDVLADVVPPARLSVPRYPLRYHLSPVVARRRDVALHFPDSTITYHDDGSALVTATIDDLWEARLILLRYGAACQVLAPPELITLFRETIQNMSQIYEI
jgi:predicted DNA-binding transcriptional regulator YafY